MPPSEIQVVLPDGSKKTLPAGATGADLAKAIGPGLAKAALAIRVNGDVRDLQRPLPDGMKVSILTDKDPQALDVLRHSSAHVLATAVRQLFPKAQIGFGPPIDDGFYYDFDIGRSEEHTSELQSLTNLVCRLLLEKKKKNKYKKTTQ